MINLPPPGTDDSKKALKELERLGKTAEARGLDQFVWRGQTIDVSYLNVLLDTFAI